MKRLLLSSLLVAVLGLVSSVASAQMKFTYSDCGGATNATWTCTANTGAAFTAVASITVPALTTLTGEESMLEVAFATAVPEWWKAGTGFCRTTSAIKGNFVVPSGGGCTVDYFGNVGAGPSGGSFLTVGPNTDRYGSVDANRIRVFTVSAVDGTAAATAPQPAVGDEVFLFTLNVNKTLSTGTGSCAGCDAPACIMLKSVLLTQAVGLGDFQYNGSELLTAQTPTPDCVGVPVNRSSWGQVKSLYR